jgi:hypothetical protein
MWYGMVRRPSHPPSVYSVTEGGGVMQRGPIRSKSNIIANNAVHAAAALSLNDTDCPPSGASREASAAS